jgi:hypothetical protein
MHLIVIFHISRPSGNVTHRTKGLRKGRNPSTDAEERNIPVPGFFSHEGED